jgi:hypothetical protein
MQNIGIMDKSDAQHKGHTAYLLKSAAPVSPARARIFWLAES